MNKTSVVAIGVVVAFMGCCGISGLIGQGQRADREAAEVQQEATEAASPPPAQTETQTKTADTPPSKRRVPAWQDPTQVAGEEAGMATGLVYSQVFDLGYKVWKAGQAGSTDAVLTVAQAEGLDAGLVEDAMVTYGENRTAMTEYLRSGARPLSQGVIGRVDVKGVESDDLGPFTARVVLTVTGCPGRSDLSFLAQTAATTMTKNLPVIASGFTAILEYKGINCQSGRFGEATFDAETNKLNLK